MRIKSLAVAAAFGLTSCGPSPAPPAVVATPVVAAAEKPEPPAKDQSVTGDPPVKTEPIPDGGTFRFPEDLGGRALAKSLTPAVPPALSTPAPAAPRERKLPAFLDAPTPPLPDAASSPPRLGLAPNKEARPVALPDRVPLELGGVIPELPTRAEITPGPLTRTEGRDVAKPADLPILSAKPIGDRAPLIDPTAEFTAASVISPSLPLRTTQADFVRINLPDPFEHVDAAKPRTPVAENPNRVLGNPPPPR
ncbi:MAG TPA: hypothetical protein VHR66_12275 [Gemmataceae bacterium]|jgi:hypothetical protein|nr:hypothetical protein [Gemmataceae bacterium]